MTLGTIVRYQFGNALAIKAVAQDRVSLWVGMILVLLTAIARNYDQTFFLESPLWLPGPLLFSFFSGSFIFWILFSFIRRPFDDDPLIPSKFEQRQSFMGLFWMTAPVAWLYAIPVERFFASYQAGQANLFLLAVVSIWRVALMSRVVCVIQRVHYLRALGWVLVPASLEVLVVSFFGTAFSKNILAAMSGMRNSPEEALLLSALGSAFVGAIIVLILVTIALAVFRSEEGSAPFPLRKSGRMPWSGLLGLSLIWIAVSIPAQREQFHFFTHAKLVEEGRYRASVDYLAVRSPKDFPPSRRLSPDPYGFGVFEKLPKVMSVLRSDDPEWVRQLYLTHTETLFHHRWFHTDPRDIAEMFTALEHLPGAEAWMERNRTNMPKLKWVLGNLSNESRPEEQKAAQQITNILHRFGISQNEWEQTPGF